MNLFMRFTISITGFYLLVINFQIGLVVTNRKCHKNANLKLIRIIIFFKISIKK